MTTFKTPPHRLLLAFLMLALLSWLLLPTPVMAQLEPTDDPALTVEAAAPTIEPMPVMIVVTPTPDASLATATPTAAPTDTGSADGEDNNEAAPTSPIYYVIVVVLALLLVGAGVFNGYITNTLKTLVPPETANSIYQSGVRFGLQVALNQAAQTPTSMDDEFFTEMARLRGLTVVKRIDGTYEVTTPPTGGFGVPVDNGGAKPV
jgi:hypothetical protein